MPVPTGVHEVDVEGKLILPGLIDLHVHGGNGFDSMDATHESIVGISQYHAQHGTTAFLPTTHTESYTKTKEALEQLAQSAKSELNGAEIVGIHLEGPFINPKRAGGQMKSFIRLPDIVELQEYIAASEELVRLVTLAPEMKGGLETARWLVNKGISVSIGHSDAVYEQVRSAMSAGISQTAITLML